MKEVDVRLDWAAGACNALGYPVVEDEERLKVFNEFIVGVVEGYRNDWKRGMRKHCEDRIRHLSNKKRGYVRQNRGHIVISVNMAIRELRRVMG